VAASPSLCSRLVSLRLGSSDKERPLLLSPLGRLSALTELSVDGAVHPESAGWLPSSLVKLRLGTCEGAYEYNGIGGPGWMDAVAACAASLRSLDLVNLRTTDVWLEEAPDAFKQTLNQVSQLTGLGTEPGCKAAHRADRRRCGTGTGGWRPLSTRASWARRPDARTRLGPHPDCLPPPLPRPARPQLSALEELRALVRTRDRDDPLFESLADGLALPRLRRLVCYAALRSDVLPLLPRLGSPSLVARLASTLEELAVGDVAAFFNRDGAHGLVFPRLRRLHASSFPPNDPRDPSHFARTFPALEEVVFDGEGHLADLPFTSLPLLPGLRALGLFTRCGHGDGRSEAEPFAHVGRCGALASLRLYGVERVAPEEFALVVRAPQLRRIDLDGSTYRRQELTPPTLQAALRAAAGPSRELDVCITYDFSSKPPYGLLPDSYGRGHDI
jgi:hypothetical protein